MRTSRGEYETWANLHRIAGSEETRQRAYAARVGPLLRFVVVVDATGRAAGLDHTLESIELQTWPYLRCVVLGGAAEVTTADPRFARRAAPIGPGMAANALLADATEDLVVLLRAGDTLTRDCLYHVFRVAWRDPTTDLVTWDDDLTRAGEEPSSPYFKPAFSPDLLLSLDYIGRSAAIRTARLKASGGLGPSLDDVGLWDLHLRCTRHLDDDRVDHIPRVLSHLVSRPPTAVNDAARQIMEVHVQALDADAVVTADNGRMRVHWSVPVPEPSVSIVVCTRFNRPMLQRSLGSLHRTDYPSFEVIVVDNGDWEDLDGERWYREAFSELDLEVVRWNGPFNYSAVNNLGARTARGDILVFLNDDTEITSPGWLRELVSWLGRPGVGICGLQLRDGDGRIQHAGAFLGLTGFAGHLFAGMEPDGDSIAGPVSAYRNVLAVTGACLGIRRELFLRLGGFDERFVLCGSDVVLGLDAVRQGLRVVCSPFEPVTHLEAATRGTAVPEGDFFASFWRYQPYLFGGDPYLPPSLSRVSMAPELRRLDEPSARALISGPLKRNFTVFRQSSEASEAYGMADSCRSTSHDRRYVVSRHAATRGRRPVESVTWFFPELDSPFYGGISTALRIADHLASHHGVDNRFAVWGAGPEEYVRSGIAAAFPRLGDAPICMFDGDVDRITLPGSDAAIATLWTTAYKVAEWQSTRRRFYLIQDFEPMFYPAGTMYALAEETYRLGLYGICNTETLLRLYEADYGGRGMSFQPAVDRTIFHPPSIVNQDPDRVVTVFVYARPGHWRNCWEMASVALRDLKRRLGGRVRIVTAGSWAHDDDPEEGAAMRHLGLLDYRRTGELYRECDIGLCLTVSKHPSYLPLELMASGVAVVSFDNRHGHWLLRDGDNALLAEQTASGLTDALERLAVDPDLRTRLGAQAQRDIDERHSDWDGTLCPIHAFLEDPDGVDVGQPDQAGERSAPDAARCYAPLRT